MEYKKPIIDGHYHNFDWYNHGNRDFFQATEEYMQVVNCRSININALPSGERDVSNNIMAALFKLRHPHVYANGGLVYDTYPVPAVLTAGMETETQYQELMEIGFDGVKMLETKPTLLKVLGRGVDDPIYEALFAAAERDGTHMVWHVGDPATFWDPELAPPDCIENGWFYGDGTYPSLEEIYSQVLTVLDRHPKLNVTFAHFFFMSDNPKRLAKIFAKYPNVNVDITPGSEMYHNFEKDRAYFRDFFTRYADRIEYGTDCSDEGNASNYAAHVSVITRFLTTEELITDWSADFSGIGLDEPVLDKIFSENYLRRAGHQPKPINIAALKAYVAKYRHLVRDPRVLANIDEELQKYGEESCL